MSTANGAAGSVPGLVDAVTAHARRRPGAPALRWQGQPVSYGDLQGMVDSARNGLERLALPDAHPVGVVAKKSPHAIALILACLAAGRPVLLPSADLGLQALRQLFDRAGCRYAVTPGADPAAPFAGLRAEQLGPTRGSATTAALLLTTSGSTGTPKIVPLDADAIDRFTDWAGRCFGIAEGSTVLSYAPLNFDLCLLDIWTTLKHGGCVVLVDQSRATHGRYLVDLLNSGDVHVVQSVPMLYRLLLDAARDGGTRFVSVRHVIVTGDRIAPRTLAALPTLFPEASIYNVYGSTETNDSFIHEIDVRDAGRRPELPLGAPIPGVSALIVDAEGGVVHGVGPGELWVSTPFQTRGYLAGSGDERAFVTYPEGVGARIYFRTGDLVRRHLDGSLTLDGRADSYVKVRGVRVNTQAVEHAIVEHDRVVEAAVIAVPDDVTGIRLHAVVRRQEREQLDTLELRRHCARRLDLAAVPTTIQIVTAPLPRTSTGKLDRQRILASLPKEKAS